jgi:hypothetical protein
LLPSRLLVPWLLLLGGRRAGLSSAWGFARSVRLMLPVDAQGKPLPFLPYSVIELLKERLTRELTVLEFGAGFSTLFLMDRVKRIVTIEHDPAWINRLRPQLQDSVELIPTSRDTPDTYLAFLDRQSELYDLILIDGRHRVESFRRSLDRLTPAGVMLLDDSDRERYAPIFAEARSAGFRDLTLVGHKPGSLRLHRSTFFYRDGNCLRF